MTQAVLDSINILDNSLFKQDNEFVKDAQNNSVFKDFASLIDKKTDNRVEIKDSSDELTQADISQVPQTNIEVQPSDVQILSDLNFHEDAKEVIDGAIEITETLAENSSIILSMPSLETLEAVSNVVIPNLLQNAEETELFSCDMEAIQEDILNSEVQTDEVTNLITEDDAEIKVTKAINSSEIELKDEMVKELKIESIESETDMASNDEGMMNNSTPQEHALKAMISNDTQNFEKTVNMQQSQASSVKADTPHAEISQNKIIEQITKHFDNLQNNSRVNIVLNPESLGKVSVHIVKSDAGMSAQFMVSTEEAKEILMKGLDNLKENLLANGVGVDNVSVKLNGSQESKYQNDWTEQEHSQNGNKEQNSQNREKQKKLFEKMTANILNENDEV